MAISALTADPQLAPRRHPVAERGRPRSTQRWQQPPSTTPRHCRAAGLCRCSPGLFEHDDACWATRWRRVHNSGHWTIEGATTSQFETTSGRCSGCRLADRTGTAQCHAQPHQPLPDRCAALACPACTGMTTARRPHRAEGRPCHGVYAGQCCLRNAWPRLRTCWHPALETVAAGMTPERAGGGSATPVITRPRVHPPSCRTACSRTA